MPPQMPPNAAPQGPEMSQEQMRASLKEAADKLTNEMGHASTITNIADSRDQERKIRELGEFFDRLTSAGIDLSNPDQVRTFFDNLYKSSPDLYDMLVPYLNKLLGSPEGEESSMDIPEIPDNAQQGLLG